MKQPTSKNFTLKGPNVIDRVLLCDKCQNAVVDNLLWFLSLLCSRKRKIVIGQSFFPINLYINLPKYSAKFNLLIVTWNSTNDPSVIRLVFSFELHGTIALTHPFEVKYHSLTGFGQWHMSGKVTVRKLSQYIIHHVVFLVAWWQLCLKR